MLDLAAFDSLKQACQTQILWLRAQAEAYETGSSRHLLIQDNGAQDDSSRIAEEFHHQANNLQAVVDAYERLILRKQGRL